MPPVFAPPSDAALPLHVIEQNSCKDWLQQQPGYVADWAQANGFTGACGQVLLIPGGDGKPDMALAGYGTPTQRARRRFVLAAAAEKLPKGIYAIASGLDQNALETECLGWLLSGYRFGRYHSQSEMNAALVAPENIESAAIESLASAECLTRDLINTPASDMGPDELQAAAETLAQQFDASFSVIEDAALLDQNLPMIHAVGRASDRRPRLIDMTWGTSGPKLTLVGKGVCFDTGGLNLKPGASMGLMKKDMGGAATVLGLARMIMTAGLPLQLRVLIPAVENSVSGSAFRPGDVLTSRKGLTVEINNTDAEGRLVLADALTLADEDKPDLLISMATLTGAARVAVGPDLAPFFTDNEDDAAALSLVANASADPAWRLPFHTPYEAKIEPGIADLDNAPSGGFAGSITAALFLRRFAGESRYIHFDIYGWNPTAAPARPKGGAGQGARALFAALPKMLDL
ncbi:leucyl aminopeptidase family protein [Parasedimentitalea marina]|uniref:Leucyl aminopeptidase family protein n=1 Tax=Parasedimentitalea marina TaxID=2483033 RepID=A0A3T0MXL8_9RHOB|nr:leucyl aminopeptidase family protein [Parasedimentitalea marina]AZV76500.1 leucyl aminopeptidase family protein [Parasedimentitalea marina]